MYMCGHGATEDYEPAYLWWELCEAWKKVRHDLHSTHPHSLVSHGILLRSFPSQLFLVGFAVLIEPVGSVYLLPYVYPSYARLDQHTPDNNNR